MVNGALLLGLVLVVIPWAVILVDALLLGFNFALAFAMLVVFSIGLLVLAALAPGEA